MMIFFRYQTFRFIWLAKPTGRYLHKDHQLWAPLTLADFEAINRCEKSLPKNFNFAGDVLDQWSQKEKVWHDRLLLDAWYPHTSQASISCSVVHLPLLIHFFHPSWFPLFVFPLLSSLPREDLWSTTTHAVFLWSLLGLPYSGYLKNPASFPSFSPSPTQQLFALYSSVWAGHRLIQKTVIWTLVS